MHLYDNPHSRDYIAGREANAFGSSQLDFFFVPCSNFKDYVAILLDSRGRLVNTDVRARGFGYGEAIPIGRNDVSAHPRP